MLGLTSAVEPPVVQYLGLRAGMIKASGADFFIVILLIIETSGADLLHEASLSPVGIPWGMRLTVPYRDELAALRLRQASAGGRSRTNKLS